MKLRKLNILIPIIFLIIILYLTFDIFNVKEKRDKRARVILEDVAVWFIEEGLSGYYKDKDLNFLEESIKKRGAYLYTEICIDKYGYLANIVTQKMWVGSTVTCYSREEGAFIYEYWVVSRYGATRDDVDSEIFFIITKTKGLDKPREIINRSTIFFPTFTVSGETEIHFPLDDNEIIYEVRPWEYPDAFKDTELEGIKVVIENKKYVRKKIQTNDTNK